MIDPGVLPTYLLAVVLICLAPGTDMAYMVAVGMQDGRSAALRASAGVGLGVLVYSLVVAAGAGELVRQVPWTLTVLRALGAAYLIWLAVGAFRDARRGVTFEEAAAEDGHWFRRGLVVNLTNPKMVLFFVAFLPQFLGTAASSVAQFVMLGLVYMAVGLAVDIGVGLAAGTVQDRLARSPRAPRVLNTVAALVFLLLAAVVVYELVISPEG